MPFLLSTEEEKTKHIHNIFRIIQCSGCSTNPVNWDGLILVPIFCINHLHSLPLAFFKQTWLTRYLIIHKMSSLFWSDKTKHNKKPSGTRLLNCLNVEEQYTINHRNGVRGIKCSEMRWSKFCKLNTRLWRSRSLKTPPELWIKVHPCRLAKHKTRSVILLSGHLITS